jgi:hypothetical protein
MTSSPDVLCLELPGATPAASVLFGLSAFAQPGQVLGSYTVVPALPLHVSVALTSSSAGEFSLALPLPYDPRPLRRDTFTQALAIEGGGPFFGFAGLSNALEVRVGDRGAGRGSRGSRRGARERARLLAPCRRAGTATA